MRIDSHICMVIVPNDPHNPTKQITKMLNKIQLSQRDINKVNKDLDATHENIASKEEKLEAARTNAKIISNNLQVVNQEVSELKGKLKRNMSLLQAK